MRDPQLRTWNGVLIMASKAVQKWLNCLLLCGIALSVSCKDRAPTTAPTPKVIRVVGDARYSTNNGGLWMLLTPGLALKEGSVIQTAKEGDNHVDIALGGGEVEMIRLDRDTALGIDKRASTQTGAGVQTEINLDLRKGHITGDCKEMLHGSIYEIKYPKGVAGIREPGSVYDMKVVYGAGNDTLAETCILNLQRGSALLALSANKQVQTIPSGFSFDDSSQTLTPLPPALNEEISATIASMYRR